MIDRGDASWWKRAVFYQVYPRSFRDSDGDGLGDLRGIRSRLGYLSELGVDALWISPFYPSPMKDFGYDISDYRGVDPSFGTLDDFRDLLDEAHSRGTRIVIDLVVNHSSDEHPWFKEARSGRDSPKHDWYIWRPVAGRRKPNNWKSLFELRSAWFLNEATNEYYLGTFTRFQPEFNWRNAALREAIHDVARFWLDMGVDGFRMDVATAYVKDEGFRSNPFSWNAIPDFFQRHLYDRNRPEIHAIFGEFRKLADSYGDRVLIAEPHGATCEIAASCYGRDADELHMAFNFDFLRTPWSAGAFRAAIERFAAALPPGGWPDNTLSNHDQPRHFRRYGAKGEPVAKAKVAAAMLLSIRGTPFLYYGEELGMDCVRLPRRALRDPLGLATWPLGSLGRDPERTPMQWDGSRNSGFSSGEPWLPVNPDYPAKNAEAQSEDPGSMLSWYRACIAARKGHPALQAGEMRFLDSPRRVLAFVRSRGGESVAAFLNFGPRRVRVAVGLEGKKVILGSHRRTGERLGPGAILLGSYEVLLAE